MNWRYLKHKAKLNQSQALRVSPREKRDQELGPADHSRGDARRPRRNGSVKRSWGGLGTFISRIVTCLGLIQAPPAHSPPPPITHSSPRVTAPTSPRKLNPTSTNSLSDPNQYLQGHFFLPPLPLVLSLQGGSEPAWADPVACALHPKPSRAFLEAPSCTPSTSPPRVAPRIL